MRANHPAKGFSLIETVLALGIFSGAVVVMMGVLGALVDSVRQHAESAAAANAARAVVGYVSTLNWDDSVRLLVESSEFDTLAANDARRLFVESDAERVGSHEDALTWGIGRIVDSHRFDAVLVRNPARATSSVGSAEDAVICHVALSWPAYAESGAPLPARDRKHRLVHTLLRR